MRHFANADFWDAYGRLPKTVQELADKNFQLLKSDPRHPSLQFKKVGPYWSARVGRSYRAVAVKADNGLVWFWIGTHANYDAIISS